MDRNPIGTPAPGCAWCDAPFAPNRTGRPRRYCSIPCRQAAGHYRERGPALRAWLAELEDSERAHRRRELPVPVYLANDLATARARLNALQSAAK